MLEFAVIDDPIVKGSVSLIFEGAERVRDSFNGILYRMRKIVHGVNAPFVTCLVMRNILDYSVNNRVAHIQIGRCHIDLCAQCLFAVVEFAVLHSFKQIEVFFNGAVAVRTVFAGFGQSTAIFAHFIL